MAESMTIAEVSKLTGLPAHTLRFYEKMFPRSLPIERTAGGHRVYKRDHLEKLRQIIVLVKDNKLPIKEAQAKMHEATDEKTVETSDNSGGPDRNLTNTLTMVLQKLEEICRKNDRFDSLLEMIVREKHEDQKLDLLDQIAECRRETRETIRLYRKFLARNHQSQ